MHSAHSNSTPSVIMTLYYVFGQKRDTTEDIFVIISVMIPPSGLFCKINTGAQKKILKHFVPDNKTRIYMQYK